MGRLNTEDVRYMIDGNGRITHAVVPMELWYEMSGQHASDVGSDWPQDERERRRIEEAMNTPEHEMIPLPEVMARLGISEDDLR